MAPAFRFQFLLEQAQEKSDKAARLMAEVKAQWQGAEQKLLQLQQFVDDYRQRFGAAQATGLSVGQWRDYQLFMAKLDAAVKQQAGEVELAEAQTVLAWCQAHAPGPCGPLDDGGAWDAEQQQTQEGDWVTVTLTLTGPEDWGREMLMQFGQADS